MTKEYPWGKGTPIWSYLLSTNDSDVSLTVPAGKIRVYDYIYCELTATGNAGSRVLGLYVTDGINPLYTAKSGVVAAASQKTAMVASTNFDGYSSTIPTSNLAGDALTTKETRYMPFMVLSAASIVRVWDTAAIDAAADDMIVVTHYIEYDA